MYYACINKPANIDKYSNTQKKTPSSLSVHKSAITGFVASDDGRLMKSNVICFI